MTTDTDKPNDKRPEWMKIIARQADRMRQWPQWMQDAAKVASAHFPRSPQ